MAGEETGKLQKDEMVIIQIQCRTNGKVVAAADYRWRSSVWSVEGYR